MSLIIGVYYMKKWSNKFEKFICKECGDDLAHDINHIKRVVTNAMNFCREENAKEKVVLPAAWLHDCVVISKGSPERSKASRLAADKAITFLQEVNYPKKYWDEIHHAIVAHSYSANVNPETLEAKIVQDADRIDAMGAIGVARVIIVGASLKRQLYCPDDPLCKKRKPQDNIYSVDHFYEKILRLDKLLHTEAAKKEAKTRMKAMKQYLKQLEKEISFCDE